MTQLETVKGITKYDYDNEGRLIAQTAPDGTVFRNEYDPVGNIIKSVNEKHFHKHHRQFQKHFP